MEMTVTVEYPSNKKKRGTIGGRWAGIYREIMVMEVRS
jgi:hypothetical protein